MEVLVRVANVGDIGLDVGDIGYVSTGNKFNKLINHTGLQVNEEVDHDGEDDRAYGLCFSEKQVCSV